MSFVHSEEIKNWKLPAVANITCYSSKQKGGKIKVQLLHYLEKGNATYMDTTTFKTGNSWSDVQEQQSMFYAASRYFNSMQDILN